MDMGSYVEAETLLLPLTGETDFNQDAAVLLLTSYGGQGKIDEITDFLQNHDLRVASMTSFVEPL